MKKKLTFPLALASMLYVCSVALAQDDKQSPTNCDAVKIINAGKLELTITPVPQIVQLPCRNGYFYLSGTEWIELSLSRRLSRQLDTLLVLQYSNRSRFTR